MFPHYCNTHINNNDTLCHCIDIRLPFCSNSYSKPRYIQSEDSCSKLTQVCQAIVIHLYHKNDITKYHSPNHMSWNITSIDVVVIRSLLYDVICHVEEYEIHPISAISIGVASYSKIIRSCLSAIHEISLRW